MLIGENTWIVQQIGYSPEKESFYESIFSLANGYMGIRGFEEEKKDVKGYELCTFIAGIFDYFKPGITDMVNIPNYNSFKLIANDTVFSFDVSKIIDYKRTLNLKNGTLLKCFIWEDEKGNKTKVESLKFLSIFNKHIACIKYKITPLNYRGKIVIETGIDGRVRNNPINDDQMKNDISPIEYLGNITTNTEGNLGALSAITRGTEYKISLAFCIELKNNIEGPEETFEIEGKNIIRRFELYGESNIEYELNKYVTVFTSRDNVVDPLQEAMVEISKAREAGYENLYNQNSEQWTSKWDIADVEIIGDDISQQGIRYNIFQLIQASDEGNENISIGARGLTHSRYKGCYFWDTDIFMLPFYNYTNPKAAKSLLMYRYHTIEGARKNAKNQNVDGARYPWMCSIDGVEQCDTWDIGLSEIHITADIAYALNQYSVLTSDKEFIRDYGAEILIETARYWKSRFTYNAETDKYNLLCVKGPNEYGGVSNNNTYTIFMAINNFKLAIEAIKLLTREYSNQWNLLKEKLVFNDDEIQAWLEISKKTNINYDESKKLYLEDDNFQKLEPCDINTVREGNKASYHKVCFDKLQRYKILKQADVLLLMLMLSQLFTKEEKKNAWYLYEPITLHDSSLSFGTHAQFAASIGLVNEAYNYFVKSVRYDLDDIMENVAKEGIHMASLGASWQAVINGFGGISTESGVVDIKPLVPPNWSNLSFSFIFRNNFFKVGIFKEYIDVLLCNDSIEERAVIKVKNNEISLFKGKKERIYL